MTQSIDRMLMNGAFDDMVDYDEPFAKSLARPMAGFLDWVRERTNEPCEEIPPWKTADVVRYLKEFLNERRRPAGC